jgi:glycosyltransferase involved in cell wall biosynthesis
VGTLSNRRIDDTIEGFGRFYNMYKDKIPCSYKIIGTGNELETEAIYQKVEEHKLEGVVELTGYIPHDDLIPYLQEANIGVSYVPITTYYDIQPPTKTYEYLLGGMAVLATATQENALVIDEHNGVLIQDNPQAFAEGLERLYQNRLSYDGEGIQRRALQYSWDNIVKHNLLEYLSALDGDKLEYQPERLAHH